MNLYPHNLIFLKVEVVEQWGNNSIVHSTTQRLILHEIITVNKIGTLRGCLDDPALPGCNEAWDCFDVLKIAIRCGLFLSKIVS